MKKLLNGSVKPSDLVTKALYREFRRVRFCVSCAPARVFAVPDGQVALLIVAALFRVLVC